MTIASEYNLIIKTFDKYKFINQDKTMLIINYNHVYIYILQMFNT